MGNHHCSEVTIRITARDDAHVPMHVFHGLHHRGCERFGRNARRRRALRWRDFMLMRRLSSGYRNYKEDGQSNGSCFSSLHFSSSATRHCDGSALRKLTVVLSTSRSTERNGVSLSISKLWVSRDFELRGHGILLQTRLMATSMLPRVAIEYGQIWCASPTRNWATARSTPGTLTLSRARSE